MKRCRPSSVFLAVAAATALVTVPSTAHAFVSPSGGVRLARHQRQNDRVHHCGIPTATPALHSLPPGKSAHGGDENQNEASAVTPKQKRPSRTSARMSVFQWLNRPSVEVLSATAVLLSSFLVALDTLNDLPSLSVLSDTLGLPISSDPHVVIDDTLGLINTIFAADFFVRWWAAGNFKTQYLKRPLIVLDIVVVLIPLYIGVLLPALASAGIAGPDGTLPWIPEGFEPNSAGLQNLLLLRILRLRRVLTDINTFSRFEMALGLKPQMIRPYQLQLARVLLSIFTLLSVASGLIYQAEHEVNSQIPDYFAALYFGLTTLTTVGFGDIVPITSQGRLIVCLSILAGVAVIPAQAGQLVDALVEFQQDQKKGGPRVTVRAGSAAKKAKEENGTSKNRVSSVNLREKAAEASTDANNFPVVVSKSSTTKKVAEQAEPATSGPFEGLLGRYCLECESTDHREDATYCWNCGNEL